MKTVLFCLVLPLGAFGVSLEPLPQSQFADTEVSTNIPFAVSFAAMSRIEFSLSLDASPSNCVEVSIGTDSNADGVLSLDETDQTFGYNCGTWFQRDAVREMFECSDCSIVRLNGTERAEKTFLLKKRKLDEAWDLVKVTRRGVAEIGEVALIEGKKPGAALIVR